MEKLGEALTILTANAEKVDSTICLAYTPYYDDCMIYEYTKEDITCSNCIYGNHRLLDKPIEILNKLEE